MSDIKKILAILDESTTAGAVATVSQPMTSTMKRENKDENDHEIKVLEYGNWENSSNTTSTKLKKIREKATKLTQKVYSQQNSITDESMDGVAANTKQFTSEAATKTKNPVAKAAQRVAKGSGKHKNPAKVLPRKAKHKKMYEEEITEQDLILSPFNRGNKDRALISRDHSRIDREVEMARGDVHQAQQNAAKILAMIQDKNEQEGLEGWVQEKIIKASDYLNTVREYLENRDQEQGVAEGSEQSAYIKYNQGYNDAKNSKPSIHKTLTGNDRHNYVMGYKDGLTDRKKPKEQGVAEGSTDTVYPNAEIIKSKNGKPVGEIYRDGNSWGCFHYRADRGYDMIDSREDAIQALKDLHQETGRSRPDYTIKGVAEGSDNDSKWEDTSKWEASVWIQYSITSDEEIPYSDESIERIISEIMSKHNFEFQGSGGGFNARDVNYSYYYDDLRSVFMAAQAAQSEIQEFINRVENSEIDGIQIHCSVNIWDRNGKDYSMDEIEKMLSDSESDVWWRDLDESLNKIKQGVTEGANDTVYPNAEIIKSKNGKPVGEIYRDGNSWGCFHYRADRGYDMIDSREDAIQALKDLHQETGRSRPDYTIKGVAEGIDSDTQRLEQDIRDALANGDDYTAKQYVKMASTPEAKKYLQKIIRQEMYGTGPGQGGVAEGYADQQRKIFKKNGKPVGEVGIDSKASPGVGQWYMKCYAYDIDYSGYDSYEEAVAELKHCLKQGVTEGSEQDDDYSTASFEKWKKQKEYEKEYDKKKPAKPVVPDNKDQKKGVEEDLDANQRRVGQLGPTEKIGKRGTRGRLVGGN